MVLEKNSKLSKNQQLLSIIIKLHTKASITVLMKLCYLIDLVSIKKTGKQISDYEYVRYHYGPYDENINNDLDHLVKMGIIVPFLDFTPVGEEYVVYGLNNDCKEKITIKDISVPEIATIKSTIKNLIGYGAKALTEIAYKTKPMLKIKAKLGGTEHFNEKLDLRAS